MTDVHQESPIVDQQATYGSLERGLAGQFEFSISAIINEAWAKTKGNKGAVWLAFVLYIVIYAAVSFLTKYILGLFGINVPTQPTFTTSFIFPSTLSNMILLFATAPMSVGLFMLSLKMATNQSREATDIFNYYPLILKLFLTNLVMYTLIIIGFCLFILPGIYLALAYCFALPLVVEKNLDIWQALETSRKAITHIWFKLFGLFIVMTLLAFAATIPLGIGLVWVLPMFLIVNGIIYRNIFGIGKATAVEA